MNEESIEIDIRPEVNILSVLRHLNYSPWFALAEFVDNSLASFLEAKASGRADADFVEVSIVVESTAEGRIVIKDNAYGISAEDFPRAFRAADVPPDRSGLSEFGMGMKSAASWFARKWTVRTSIAGESVTRSIEFNLDDIVKHQTNKLQAITLPASPGSHFTTIELRGLNHLPQGRTIGKIRSHLASIYRQFLRRGELRITVNGEPVAFTEVDILKATPAWIPGSEEIKWKKDVFVDLGDGRIVSGFAALRTKGSTSEAGFALFRRDRLIEGSFDDTYRPQEIFKRSTSYPYQRIFGELQLDGFDVSHTKDGFRWDEYEEPLLAELSKQLASGELDILRQAEEYRVNLPQPDERLPVVNAATQVANVLESGLPDAIDAANIAVFSDDFIADFLTGESETTLEPKLEPVEKLVKIKADDGLWLIRLSATLDDASPDWLQVGSQYESEDPDTGESAHTLDVTVNFAHPFTRQHIGVSSENSELFLTLASGLGMALALGKKSGARSQFVLSYLNLILRTSFHLS